MRVAVLSCVVLAVACGPTYGPEFSQAQDNPTAFEGMPALEIALGIWADEHGLALAECVQTAGGATYERLDPLELAGVCELELGDAIACAYELAPARIALEDSARGRSEPTRAHELLHVLHACHFNRGNRPDGDGRHQDGVWEHLYDPRSLAELRARTARL